MKTFLLVLGLLFTVALPCYSQNWTAQDSLRLQKLLDGEKQPELNPEAIEELFHGKTDGKSKAVKAEKMAGL
ncbi:DUF4858 domain-containing protein [Bacteroides ndongoniae]|uniref:DUF4858 domain-containing protein n=1 Tax=Bacteroides ndongoniae TaxID=1903262 RepID=UPI002937247D|nr:DUF4858 domain-containing protein [Bacteroides ndongoniae]